MNFTSDQVVTWLSSVRPDVPGARQYHADHELHTARQPRHRDELHPHFTDLNATNEAKFYKIQVLP